MTKFINKIALLVINYSFLFFCFMYFILNVVTTTEIIEYHNYYEYFNFTDTFIAICIGLIFYFIVLKIKNINSKHILILFLLSTFSSGLFVIINLPTELVRYDDAYKIINIVNNMVIGDFSGISFNSYINCYPFQVPFVSYYYILARVFGSNYIFVIRLINLIFSTLGFYYLYKITNLLFKNETANKIVVLLFLISNQLIILSFITYTHGLSYSISIISIYYFLSYYRNNKLKDLILSLFFLVISVLLRQNGLIILFAYIIFEIIKIFTSKNYKALLIIFSSYLVIFSITFVTTAYFEKMGQVSYDSKIPTSAYIAYGINYNPSTPGHHFPDIENFLHDNYMDQKATDLEAKRYIGYSLDAFSNNPIVFFQFIFNKLNASYTVGDVGSFYSLQGFDENELIKPLFVGNTNKVLNLLWNSSFILAGFSSLFYIFKNLNKNKLVEMLLATIIFGGFLFHLVWETKAMYLYQYYLLMLPYAAYGLSILFKSICAKFRKL